MTADRHLGLALAVALVMAGCAAPQKSVPPAAAPSGGAEAPESTDGDLLQKKESEAGPGTPAFGGQFAQPPPAALDDAESLLERDFKDVARALGTAKDCETAKKALDSMKRSASRICDLNGPDDPGERCAKARDRVDAASENVRRGCGP
jgi:hypothetical protein